MKIEFVKFFDWYAKFTVKYHKYLVGFFIILSISMPFITFFTCPIPAVDDIREEFVVRGSKSSGKHLQYHNLKSLSTFRMDFSLNNSTQTNLDKQYAFHYIEERSTNIEKRRSTICSDYLFNFQQSKRIIINIPRNMSKDAAQYSTYEEIMSLCKVEQEIQLMCNEDCVTIITKAEVYRRILGNVSCNQITSENVKSVNSIIRKFTNKLMKKEHQQFSIIDCWIMRLLYYIIPLKKSNFIQMDNPGVSMLFFEFTNSELYDIYTIYNILLKQNIEIVGTKTQNEQQIVQNILKTDLTKEIYVLIIILILLFFFGKSIVISLFTFFIMTNAILISYIIYTHLLKIPTFPFINFLNFVILIALGADDIIVYSLKWNSIQNVNMCDKKKLMKTIESSLPTIFATSLSTILSLLFCFTSSIVAIKCFACYGTLLITSHLFLVVSFLPSICYLYRSTKPNRPGYFNFKHIVLFHEFCQRFIFDKLCHFFAKQIVKFYKTIFFKCLLLYVLSMMTLFLYPKLTYPKQLKNDILKSDHPNLVYSALKNKFSFERKEDFVSETKWIVNIVWGVEDLDNRSWLDLQHFSTIMINKNFNMTDPETINWLVEFCKIINHNVITPDEMKSFINYRKQRNLSNCPFDNGTLSLKRYIEVFNCSPKMDFYHQINNCINTYNDDDNYNSQNNFRFHYQNDAIVGLIIYFDLIIPQNESYQSIVSIFQNMENWFSQLLRTAPLSLRGGFLVFESEKEDLYLLYSAIAQYLPLSFFLAFSSAGFVGFVTLWDWKIICIMLLVLLLIIIFSVSTLIWLGWKIGIIEAAIFTIATGISIDFCLHFAIALRKNHQKSINVDVVEFALTDVFWPVTLTAITTGLPGIPLINSQLIIFNRLGLFLFVVTFWSIICVLFFYPSCVLLIRLLVEKWKIYCNHLRKKRLLEIEFI